MFGNGAIFPAKRRIFPYKTDFCDFGKILTIFLQDRVKVSDSALLLFYILSDAG